MEIHVADFQLNGLSVYIQGAATGHINATVSGNLGLQNSSDVVIDTVTFDPVTFTIGLVPIVLDVTIPVHAGYNFSMDAAGTIQAMGAADGQIKYGFMV